MSRNDEQSTAPLSRIEVDLSAIGSNVETLRRIVGPEVTICGVVKKNAYGLGAVTLAHRMLKAGCGMLAVFAPHEAEELNAGAVTAPILLLYPLRHLARTEGLYRPAVAERLHLAVHDLGQLDQLDQLGRTFGIKLPLHLYVDTGMSRGGLSPEQFAAALTTQSARHYTRVAGVMSHLATASGDPVFAAEQLARFDALLETHRDAIPPDAMIHVANTYGTLRSAAYHRTLVRPGLGLYGYGEHAVVGEPVIDPALRFTPCVRWLSRLIHVSRHERGAVVGYGSTHKLKRRSVLGLVPVGYGDGYPLSLSKKGVVRIQLDDTWHACPVLGRVNMDQLTVDLTDLVSATGDAVIESLLGIEVEVYSNDPAAPNALHTLADAAQSHCYELLCRLGGHVPRVFVNH